MDIMDLDLHLVVELDLHSDLVAVVAHDLVGTFVAVNAQDFDNAGDACYSPHSPDLPACAPRYGPVSLPVGFVAAFCSLEIVGVPCSGFLLESLYSSVAHHLVAHRRLDVIVAVVVALDVPVVVYCSVFDCTGCNNALVGFEIHRNGQ